MFNKLISVANLCLLIFLLTVAMQKPTNDLIEARVGHFDTIYVDYVLHESFKADPLVRNKGVRGLDKTVKIPNFTSYSATFRFIGVHHTYSNYMWTAFLQEQKEPPFKATDGVDLLQIDK